MLKRKTVDKVLGAVESSSKGVVSLDLLQSLRLCGSFTLKTTLNRLGKAGKIIRLKRGVYSANPLRDVFYCAQSVFNGYLGFSTALYLHKMIAEIPFTIVVVTTLNSKTKKFGDFTFKAVGLKEKAVGFERKNDYVVSTRAKTLFDCLYLPKYSVEEEKLLNAFKQVKLTESEWREFDYYVKKFANERLAKKMNEAKTFIRGSL